MRKVKVNNQKKSKRTLMVTFFSVIVILAIIIPISLNSRSSNVKFKKISTEKSMELKNGYELEGKKEEFLKLASEIQNAVSVEILNSDVVDEDSLKSEIKEINRELKKDTWKIFNMDNPIYWIGKWKVESDGSVKFTFAKKALEPDWVNDEDVVSYINVND